MTRATSSAPGHGCTRVTYGFVEKAPMERPCSELALVSVQKPPRDLLTEFLDKAQKTNSTVSQARALLRRASSSDPSVEAQPLIEEKDDHVERSHCVERTATNVAPAWPDFSQKKKKKALRRARCPGTDAIELMTAQRDQRFRKNSFKDSARNVLDIVTINTFGKPQLLAALTIVKRASVS